MPTKFGFRYHNVAIECLFLQKAMEMNKIKINVQTTSNPTIVKFEANTFLTQHESFEFHNIDEAKNSPLAQQLFYLPFVKTIYVSGNFVAIERYDIVEWPDVQGQVAKQIEDYLNNNGEVVAAEVDQNKKVPVSIYAESTPNPSVMRFVANKKLVVAPCEFKNIDDSKHAPLATKLFHFPFVKEVFMDENYISITKFDMAEWNDITLELREFIRNYVEEGNEVVQDMALEASKTQQTQHTELENLDDTSKEIVNILDEYVKPAVASDGGNIVFQSFDQESKTVKVILQGACSGCPSSTFTLKNGIETMLREMMNGRVMHVEAING